MKDEKLKMEENWVLKNVSFTLNSGDSLGVIGKNGAGKSTLMRLLAGIIAPDTGRITVRDNTKIALLGLNGGIYPYLTGAQNIVIGGVLLGFSEREVLSKFDEIVEFSALGKVLYCSVRLPRISRPVERKPTRGGSLRSSCPKQFGRT